MRAASDPGPTDSGPTDSGPTRAEVTTDPREFLSRASDFLLTDPVRCSVLSTVPATQAALSEQAGCAQNGVDTYAWLRSGSGEVVGAAMRTPPRGLVISPLPPDGLRVLTEALLPYCADAGSVAGPEPDVSAFVEVWTERTGQVSRVGRAERIHRLEKVIPPVPPGGQARLATRAELDLVVEWSRAFESELYPSTVPSSPDPNRLVRAEQRIQDGRAHVWDDGGPVSYVGTNRPVGGVVRVGPVYTPPEYRGHGYASALTAEVSRLALESGTQACMLYTDLANPTSNRIYATLGYRPVCEATVYDLTGSAAGRLA